MAEKSGFAEASALTKRAGEYAGVIAEGWDITGNANGGYLMAMQARAALLESERRDVISVSAHFLSPGRPGPVWARSEMLKSGRRFATSRVDLRGPDKVLLSGTVITGDLDDGQGPELILGEAPDLPPPEDCELTVPSDPFPPPFMARIEQRLHPGDSLGSRNGPSIRGWFRLLDGEPLDTLAVILAADNFPPTVFNTDLPIGWVPTVQMTVHVRRRPTTAWLKLDTRTRFVQNGLFEVDANIFDEHDRIVAQSRQLQLIAQP